MIVIVLWELLIYIYVYICIYIYYILLYYFIFYYIILYYIRFRGSVGVEHEGEGTKQASQINGFICRGCHALPRWTVNQWYFLSAVDPKTTSSSMGN